MRIRKILGGWVSVAECLIKELRKIRLDPDGAGASLREEHGHVCLTNWKHPQSSFPAHRHLWVARL